MSRGFSIMHDKNVWVCKIYVTGMVETKEFRTKHRAKKWIRDKLRLYTQRPGYYYQPTGDHDP
jgi:hypothetical protein